MAAAIIPAIASAVTAAGTTAAQNSANSAAVRDTNATNLKIAYMNNINSQQQFEKNMQWLQEQFYKQRQFSLEDRAHNDIGAVVNRALAAGINPSALVGNGQSQGQNVSSVGAPAPTQFQAPHIEPAIFDYTGLSEGIGRAVDMFFENQLKNEQAKGAAYDNQIKAAQSSVAFWKEITQIRSMMADIDEKLSHIPVNSAQADVLRKQKESIERDLFEKIDSYNERREQLENGNAFMMRQTQHIGFEENMETMRYEMEKDLARSGIDLNAANSALAIANQGRVVAETAGIQYSNNLRAAAEKVRIAKEHLDEAQEQSAKAGVFKPLVTMSEYKKFKRAVQEYEKQLEISKPARAGQRRLFVPQ